MHVTSRVLGRATSVNRYFPALVFLVTSAIGLALTWFVYQATEANTIARFERIAGEAANRVTLRVEKHVSLLVATRALFEATGGIVGHNSFRGFVDGLGIEGQYDGVQGIGFAKAVRAGSERFEEANLRANGGIEIKIWPDTDQRVRTPIVLLEPDNLRNHAALGYDMFSEPRRRAAMMQAATTGEARASAPVELVQEITSRKQAGFLVYLPFAADYLSPPESLGTELSVGGFVYAPFRAGDLHEAALASQPTLPVYVETFDITEGDEEPLYRSSGSSIPLVSKIYSVDREVDLLGRQWLFRITATPAFSRAYGSIIALVVGSVSLLLALTLAIAARSQQQAAEVSRRLQGVLEKNLEDKDLMLNEMKHRIKNALSRVLAISRQTAANSGSLAAYSESFSARLEAMSAAQDLLTRGRGQSVDLRELLEKELQQIFGQIVENDRISGVPVRLNERGTQALGLTFHELATNALKYGGIGDSGGDLSVEWIFVGAGDERRLDILWSETSNRTVSEPATVGFGSRLIQASIESELGGTIDRKFSESGMSVRISIPEKSLV